LSIIVYISLEKSQAPHLVLLSARFLEHEACDTRGEEESWEIKHHPVLLKEAPFLVPKVVERNILMRKLYSTNKSNK
jgi:hypothetical protein